MRACVSTLSTALAAVLAALAFAQPAVARDGRKPSHRETPIISGYAMPQSFARTDATDTAAGTWQTQRVSAPAQPRVREARRGRAHDTALDAMIARHAAANGLPVELVHRVVIRESNYNPRASSKGNYGLMQIRHGTARGLGYSGSTSGLLDPETNLTYAVRYLAGAYRAAGGNHSRAVALYARGYHGRGVAVARRARSETVADAGGWSTQSWGGEPWGMQQAPVSLRADDSVRRHRRHR